MAPTGLVGREPEAAVASFLGWATRNSRVMLVGGGGVMLVEGQVGIGKTSIVATTPDTTQAQEWRMLAANPAELEMPLERSGIADPLEPLPFSLTNSLAEPPRRAIRRSGRSADRAAIADGSHVTDRGMSCLPYR
jgi:hypothetical protein